MEFIKNLFKKITAFAQRLVGYGISKCVDRITPLVAQLSSNKPTTTSQWFNAMLGFAGVVAMCVAVSMFTAIMATALTMVFGLVLPITIANIIAVIITLVWSQYVIRTAKQFKEDEGFNEVIYGFAAA